MQLKNFNFIIISTFIVSLGLTIVFHNVLGLRIDGALTGPLDLGTNKIINLGAPTAATDAATQGWAEGRYQRRVGGTCSAGQGIRAVNADGSVTCESAGNPLLPDDVVAAGYVVTWRSGTRCNCFSFGRCTGCGTVYTWPPSSYSKASWHDPRGNVLNLDLSSLIGSTVSGCYSDGSCTVPLVVNNLGDGVSFTCNAPYVSKTNSAIYSNYSNDCSNADYTSHIRCFGTKVCSPP